MKGDDGGGNISGRGCRTHHLSVECCFKDSHKHSLKQLLHGVWEDGEQGQRKAGSSQEAQAACEAGEKEHHG